MLEMSKIGHYSCHEHEHPSEESSLDAGATLKQTSSDPLCSPWIFIPNHPPAQCPTTSANLKAELIISDWADALHRTHCKPSTFWARCWCSPLKMLKPHGHATWWVACVQPVWANHCDLAYSSDCLRLLLLSFPSDWCTVLFANHHQDKKWGSVPENFSALLF